MMCNNPNVDLVNINAYIKFGKILHIYSQEIERNEIWRKPRAITLVQMCEKLHAPIQS